MLQETLKQATSPDHDQLEQLMYVGNIMAGTLTIEQYKQILITNYIVHKNFEHTLFSALSPELAQELNLPHREKLAALKKDMDELNIPETENDTEEITFHKNDAELLGAMYVLEGATLGGSVIVKRLKANPNFEGLNFNYYQVYSNQLIPMWKRFCEVLNQQPESTFNDAVAGAKKMFGYIAAVQQQNSLVQ
jgi:heme oxygenase